MCSTMSCGYPSLGRGMFGPVSVGRHPWSSPRRAGLFDPLLHLAYGVQILIQFLLIESADSTTKVPRISQNRIEHASVTLLSLVLEQLVKCQSWIHFQRSRCRRAAPGNMRAVEHRVILMHRRVRLLATEHKTWQLRLLTDSLGKRSDRRLSRTESSHRRKVERRTEDCRSANCECCL